MQAKINASMTCLQGYVRTSYDALVRVFGEPHWRNGDKTTVEWAFEHEGVRFTLYDYKAACPKNDRPWDFHIGGDSQWAVHAVKRFMAEAGELAEVS